jgi:Flp pilus assembly protein TadD
LQFWAGSPFEDGSGEDRLVFQALTQVPPKTVHPGRPSGKPTSYYRMNPADSMHLSRLQALRERGVVLPSAEAKGIRPLSEIVAAFRAGTPTPSVAPADDLLIRELVQRLKPAEILALGTGDDTAVLDLAGWALAENPRAIVLVADDSAVLSARIAAQGFHGGVVILPAALAASAGGPARWLASAPIAVDLVYIASEAPAGGLAEAAALGWSLLRPGGMMIGEGPVEPGSPSGAALGGFAASAGVDLLPASLFGHHRWLMQKGDEVPEEDQNTPEALYAKGLAAHGAGDVHTANKFYQQVLALQPEHPPSLHMLGVMALQLGQMEAAEKLTAAAVELDPRSAVYRNDHGEALRHNGKLEAAAAQFERALELDPALGSIYNNFGILRQAQGRFDDAVPLFRRAIELAPDSPTASMNLGVALMEKGELDQALVALEAAEALAPRGPAVRLNLANARLLLGQPAEAEAIYRAILADDPRSLDAAVNLARSLREQGKLAESLALYDDIEANLPPEADPVRPIISFNKGMAQLLAGDLRSGWQGFAMRAAAGAAPAVSLSTPRWQGESLAGKRLLIHAEQGLGDTLQFIRFIPKLRETFAPASVALVVQPALLNLLGSAENAPWLQLDHLSGPEQALPVHDLYASLLDLGLYLGIGLDDLPVAAAYLSAGPDAVRSWQDRIGSLEGKKAGLVWKGRKEHGNDRNRSMPIGQAASLLQRDGVSWVSLQRDATGLDLAVLQTNGFIADPASELPDMAATAALITALDLVVTVDTSVAHLAGALGKPVWLMLAHSPDWRWLWDRADSPWYPSARLFRQKAPGDWQSVIDQVTSALGEG